MTSEHGTYSVSDGTRVDFADAMDRWVPLAHEILVQTAKTYNATTTYKQLTEAVQESSGIRTKMLIGHWSGKLLERVAQRAVDAGEPPLTSLCVHQDGTIGPGYLHAPRAVADTPDADVEELAAEHRLLCYRRYAADLPADGGTPTLTAQVSAARSRRARTEPRPRATCPTHFVELSATGVCSDCD
ncbi:MAG TPA: hypothetical protein K8V08_09325 [Brevibacterium senegalense]|uniref:Uncharacterized protein n=1 Tax=Brevibacterium senegalense TaxID=1033736 RepID=A0A921MER7_9MICO|nr:hypothetical protein [Brevibacterium senegalense]